MKKIIVSAPGKLILLGEHAVLYRKPCLVTAVNQRMRATIEVLNIPEFQLEADDVKVAGYKKSLKQLGIGDIPRGAKFVEIAVKNIAEKYPLKFGLRITTKSEFSSQFGFGSSAASTVCAIKALSELLKLKLTPKEIFDLSYKTVLDIQGKGSGFDIAAAIYGGTLLFLTGGKTIQQLKTKKLPLVVGYSGVKTDTVTIINQVEEKAKKYPEIFQSIYENIGKLVLLAKAALEENDWQSLGELMNNNQRYLNELGVSSQKLESLISAARTAGAYGAKLSGAGGGDCMIALAPENKKQKVREAIRKVGGQIIEIDTSESGVKLEKLG